MKTYFIIFAAVVFLISGCRLNDDDAPDEIIEVRTPCEQLEAGNYILAADQQFNLYPNPNNGVFNVEFKAEKSGHATLRLLDASGRALFCNSYSVDAGNNIIRLGRGFLASGLYILQFYYMGRLSQMKVVVE